MAFGGKQRHPLAGESIRRHEILRIAHGGAADIDRAVAAARDAFDGPWGRMAAVERGRMLSRHGADGAGEGRRAGPARGLDVGKPLKQAQADALALARYLEFYGGAADKLHGETIPYRGGYTV